MKMTKLYKKALKGEITATEFENAINQKYKEIQREQHKHITAMIRTREMVE